MINLIKSLFNSDSTLLKAGIAGVDKVILTEEEKRDWFISIMKAYEPFRKAQRFLALIFCPPYVLAWLVAFFASFWVDVSYQIQLLEGPIGTIVGIIAAFYFGGGFIEGTARTIISERKKK